MKAVMQGIKGKKGQQSEREREQKRETGAAKRKAAVP